MIDNMIAMLEKYANHLEELVAERTSELDVEKKKTENLLYRMLPQYVVSAFLSWCIQFQTTPCMQSLFDCEEIGYRSNIDNTYIYLLGFRYTM